MRRLSLFALLAALAVPAAHSQIVSVYGTFSPLHASNVATGSVASGSSYTEQYASFWTPALGGGVTLNFLPIGPVRLGIDFRGSTKSGTVGADTALGGLKATIKVPLIAFKPYLQGSVGYLATRTVNTSSTSGGGTIGGTFTNKYIAYEFFGGVDYSIFPFIDLRLVELGAGQGLDIGISSSPQNASLFTVNSGIVFHF